MAKAVVYDGRHDAVDVYDPKDGSVIAVDVVRGQELEVPEYVYQELKDSDQWKDAEVKKAPAKSAAKAEPNKGDK